MILKVKKNYPDAKLPTRANESDAGLDVYVHSYKIFGEELTKDLYKSISYIEYDTGLSIQPNGEFTNNREQKDYFIYLAPRSSISNYNLVLCNGFGVIDRAYTGPVKLRMKYIHSAEDLVFFDTGKHPFCAIQINVNKIYKIGDKCGQLIVTQQPFVELQEWASLENTERNNGGFGSSGV